MIDNGESKNEEDASMISKIVIKIGEREFTATLESTMRLFLASQDLGNYAHVLQEMVGEKRHAFVFDDLI